MARSERSLLLAQTLRADFSYDYNSVMITSNTHSVSDPHLLFDYDGVIVEQADFSAAVSKKYGLQEAKLSAFFDQHLASCLRGEQDMVQLLSADLEEIGWKEGALNLFQAIYYENEQYQQEMLDFIRKDLSPKYPCYIATNQDRRRGTYIRNKGDLQSLFHSVFCSAELGVKKPDPAYFEQIYAALDQQRVGLGKEQVFFVDDSLENVVAAESFGFAGHHYQHFEDCQLAIQDWLSGDGVPVLKVGPWTLSEMKLFHAAAYADILSDPNTYQFLSDTGPKNQAQVRAKIVKNRNDFARKRAIYWAILGEQLEFVGFIAVHALQHSEVYISYGIHPKYRRQGIASSVLLGLLHWQGLAGKTKVLATHLDNAASYGMLKKLNLNDKGVKTTAQGLRHVFEME